MLLKPYHLLLLVLYAVAVIGAATALKRTVHDVPSPKIAKHRITEKFDAFHKTPNERVAEGFAPFDKPIVANGSE
jgi:hypothetical protein